jgi:hypothetical protein
MAAPIELSDSLCAEFSRLNDRQSNERMASRLRQINRKKMHRFLDSLGVRTTDEMVDRRRMLDELDRADSAYKVIMDTATALVFPRSQHHGRHTTFTQCSTRQTARSRQDSTEYTRPTYVPASKYPLPMRPIQFMPTQDARNAARVMTLSRLRQNQPVSSELDPELLDDGPGLPGIDIAKISVIT